MDAMRLMLVNCLYLRRVLASDIIAVVIGWVESVFVASRTFASSVITKGFTEPSCSLMRQVLRCDDAVAQVLDTLLAEERKQ